MSDISERKNEAARIKRWSAEISSSGENDDVVELIQKNEAFRQLCEKVKSVLMLGNPALRQAMVVNLILFEDGACTGSSFDFSAPYREPGKSKGGVA